jgi:predicted deacylase
MPHTAQGGITIAGRTVGLGTREVVPVRITQDVDGSDIVIWVHVICGAKPGPVLGVVGGQHGDEWQCLEMVRDAIADLDPTQLTGAVLAVPVCNPPAFARRTRDIQPQGDSPDLNRIWPGHYNWVNDTIAKVMSAEVMDKCDTILDFHSGPWGSTFYECFYGADIPNPDVVRASRELAFAFGMEGFTAGEVVTKHPGPRSLTAYAGTKLGIPTLGFSLGGVGVGEELERKLLGEAVRGIRNVMRHMGILDEPLERSYSRVLETKGDLIRVDPWVGGLLVPENEPDKHLRRVAEGELLGRVMHPQTFEEVARIESPVDGWLIYFARTYPVRPGDWAFGIQRFEGSQWIDIDGLDSARPE